MRMKGNGGFVWRQEEAENAGRLLRKQQEFLFDKIEFDHILLKRKFTKIIQKIRIVK